MFIDKNTINLLNDSLFSSDRKIPQELEPNLIKFDCPEITQSNTSLQTKSSKPIYNINNNNNINNEQNEEDQKEEYNTQNLN